MSTVKTRTEGFAGEGRWFLIGNVAMVEGAFIYRFSIECTGLLTVAAQASQAGVSKTATAVTEIAKRMERLES
jgi:hypothetical protein